MDVLTATEIVEQCKIPVAIATAVINWNPNRLAAKARHQQMIDRLKNRKV